VAEGSVSCDDFRRYRQVSRTIKHIGSSEMQFAARAAELRWKQISFAVAGFSQNFPGEVPRWDPIA